MSKDCNGCGEKDVEEISKAGAEMARSFMDRLGLRKADEERKEPPPEAAVGPSEAPEAPRVQARPLKRLGEREARLVGEQFAISREAQKRARDLITMAMPEVPEGSRIHFEPKDMTYYLLVEEEKTNEPAYTNEDS